MSSLRERGDDARSTCPEWRADRSPPLNAKMSAIWSMALSVGTRIFVLVADQLTFLPGVGFRQSGTRLARETITERDGLRLIVRELVSTPGGTDLTYEITDPDQGGTCVIPGRGPTILDGDTVTLRGDGQEYGSAFITSSGVIVGGVRRTLEAQPLPSTIRTLELKVASSIFGEWIVPLELVPFGADGVGRLHPVTASARHEDITIRVLGISETPDATAIRFETVAGVSDHLILGVGGLHGLRAGANALVLRDDRGREYPEIAKQDAREPMDRQDLALFEGLAADARELELEVPFVCLEEAKAPVVVPLPVVDPVSVALGRYAIRVLSTGGAPDSPRRRNFGPALAVRLDLGGWQGDRRVLFPTGVLLDGNNLGMGYGNGISGTSPEPVDTIEVRMPDPSAPKLLTLIAPAVQVRGPWRVKFARPVAAIN